MSCSLSSTVSPCTRADWITWRSPLSVTLLPALKRRFGKSVMMRHLSSPRMPCAASTWATTRNAGGPAGSDDVEVDSGAFSGGGGFDERAEAADDTSLAAHDFADALHSDLQLVTGAIAIMDLFTYI